MSDESRILRLTFPSLLAIGEVMLCNTKRDFTRFHFRAFSDGRLLLKNGSNRKMTAHWLITCDGSFWRIETRGVRRAFWRPIAPVVDFTLAECSIQREGQLGAEVLLRFVEPLHSPAGFPRAGQLKGFLRKQPPQRLFDATAFEEFWQKHCPPLKSKDTWGEVLELGE